MLNQNIKYTEPRQTALSYEMHGVSFQGYLSSSIQVYKEFV